MQEQSKGDKSKISNSPVTVIWCWPDCNYLVIEHPFISFHYQLMGTTYIVNVVCMVKSSNNTATK